MGEVKVRVKLVNAGDEILVRRGALRPDQVRVYETEAVVDTGAVRSMLPPHVCERLGIVVVAKRVARYADGGEDIGGATEPVRIEILDRDTYDDALVLGDQVLIGQTVLEKTDLLVDCREGKVIPNPAHPDQPVNHVR
jgi:clan AA aspartic protease